MNEFPTNYQELIYIRTYSRWIENENRRETWNETVDRYYNFFITRVPEKKKEEFKNACNLIKQLKIMPSMRCLWTAGKSLERENIAGYNCSATAIDNIKSFSEILYILMNGVGVGYSVENKFINKLPNIPDEIKDSDEIIEFSDSKKGWAIGFNRYLKGLWNGINYKYDLSKIRPAGERLKTFGGRASGPECLQGLLEYVYNIFINAKGRKLTSLEVHDICCKISEIVVVGGVRRSACISFSDLNDDKMRHAKDGQFWVENPHRSLSNNSAVYNEKPSPERIMKEWVSLIRSKSGERGIFNRKGSQKFIERNGHRKSNFEFLTNPCSEILLRSKELCNLSSVIIKPKDTLNDLKIKVRNATILGVLQSTLTKFNFVSREWKKNCEEERLLGVSLTGLADHSILKEKSNKAKEWLFILKQEVIETMEEWCNALEINNSVSVTCIKPEGCVTLDTKIRTIDGSISMKKIFKNINIESAKKGDWFIPDENIYVYDENNILKKITKLYVNGYSSVYEIEFDDGNKYKFTGNHKLKTKNGWKLVSDIKKTDMIISYLMNLYKINMKIKNIKKIKKEQMTIDIEVNDSHTYQLSNGIVSHNTVSQLCDTSSGLHARYAPFYIRRIRIDKKDPLCQLLIDSGINYNPENGQEMESCNTVVFDFPIKSPNSSLMRDEKTAIEQLEYWKMLQDYWCTHKPSCTIFVKEDEWISVLNWIYTHWDYITGISFLPYDGGIYKLAPYEEISEEEYEELIKKIPNIDFTLLSNYENEDQTIGAREFACIGGSCEI